MNIAYEAVITDLIDVDVIGSFHLDVYGKSMVNYNWDIEIFLVLNAIPTKISCRSPYRFLKDMRSTWPGVASWAMLR